MAGLFRRNLREPLDYELRKYFEHNLIWLMYQFPEPPVEERKILTPTIEDFPVNWNNSVENAIEVLKTISKQMQISFDDIELNFFRNAPHEMNMGGAITYLQSDPENPEAAGHYQV